MVGWGGGGGGGEGGGSDSEHSLHNWEMYVYIIIELC